MSGLDLHCNFGTMSLFSRKAFLHLQLEASTLGRSAVTTFAIRTLPFEQFSSYLDFSSDLMLGFHTLSYQVGADHIKSVFGDNIKK